MSETLTVFKKIALGTTLAVGGLSLASCAEGKSVTETFTYAVDCNEKDINVLSSEISRLDKASVIFDCEGEAPASINLISGGDTVTIEPANGDETIAIMVTNVTGDMGLSTELKSETKVNSFGKDGEVTISGVDEIHSVVVGSQLAGETQG